jgi:hypothetical protein
MAEKTAAFYKVLNKTMVRHGVEADSAKVGPVDAGEIIETLEAQQNAAGVTRIRFSRGWVSLVAGNGKLLLEPLAGASPGGRRLAVPVKSTSTNQFHQAKWTGVFEERWPNFSQVIRRTEIGQTTMKELAAFLQKRSTMEEQTANSLRTCLGSGIMSSAVTSAKSSALGWLSSATGGAVPNEAEKSKAPVETSPSEAAFSREPFDSLRDALMSVTVGECTRKAAEHKHHADELKAIAASVSEFLMRHTEKRDKTVLAASARMKTLDAAYLAVKKAEGEFDRFRSQAVQVDQELEKYMADDRMARSPVVEKLSAQLTDLRTKREVAQREFKQGLESAIQLEKVIYERDLPNVLTDFHRLEENRLSILSDTLAKYARVGAGAAAAATNIQAVLDAVVVPVDVAFDLDCMNVESVVPEKGNVPVGYLRLPKQLVSRLTELGGSLPADHVDSDESDMQVCAKQHSVQLSALAVNENGVPQVISRLCEAIAESHSTMLLETADFNAVVDLYERCVTEGNVQPCTESAAVCLACLRRVVRICYIW